MFKSDRIICFLSVFATISSSKCPTLITDFSQDDCISRSTTNGDSFYYHLDENNGCIPKCQSYKETIYRNCSSNKRCMPGFTCEKRCGPDDILKEISCQTDKDCSIQNNNNVSDVISITCEFYCVPDNKESCMAYHINTKDYKDTYWSAMRFKPSCNNDGTWKAKQCKGGINGRCMCFDSDGNRIFGEALFANAKIMTCACSRRKSELEKTRDTTFHCDSMGNYESLQCDEISKQCWCVEPATGNLVSTVVPARAVHLLPCYSVETYGNQYLRQCESKKFALSRIRNKKIAHGILYVNEDFIMCDDDGSFGRIKIENDSAYCIWRNNTKIEPWQTSIQNGYNELNCNCARDYYMYGHRQSCLSSGNYKPLQNDAVNNVWYCVDRDGFIKSDLMVGLNNTDDSYCSQFY